MRGTVTAPARTREARPLTRGPAPCGNTFAPPAACAVAARPLRHYSTSTLAVGGRIASLSPTLGRHHGDVTTGIDTVTLWRPTGPEELALVEASGWRKWPPRLAGQPIFYPVLNEEYATKIARDWNVRQSGVGYVTRFEVHRSFLDQYEVHQVGGQTILEYWIPAEDLDALNASIVGTIKVIAEFH